MDRKRAERQFNWQAIKESVERMRPELIAASEAAHKAKESDVDPAEPELDRTLELGYLVDCLGGLCGPHLAVLSEIDMLSMSYMMRIESANLKNHITRIRKFVPSGLHSLKQSAMPN